MRHLNNFDLQFKEKMERENKTRVRATRMRLLKFISNNKISVKASDSKKGFFFIVQLNLKQRGGESFIIQNLKNAKSLLWKFNLCLRQTCGISIKFSK